MIREKHLYHCKTMMKMGKKCHSITKNCIYTEVAAHALDIMPSLKDHLVVCITKIIYLCSCSFSKVVA